MLWETDELLTLLCTQALGTMAGPTANAIAIPKYPANVPMAVAVVRSFGGNHVADTRGGPPTDTGAPDMTRNWPMWVKIARTFSLSNGIT